MTTDQSPTTRRAFLAGAVGGIGAWAAGAVKGAAPVSATDGQPIIQSADNAGSGSTVVRSSGSTALQGVSDANSGTNYGVRGRTNSPDGAGVYGVAGGSDAMGVSGVATGASGIGVRGESFWHMGVHGTSDRGWGVYGRSILGIGVRGTSDSTGVYGYTGGTGTAVKGRAGAGKAIHGISESGWAGFFDGKVFTKQFMEVAEVTNPAAPNANRARIFIRDNGSGKTQLCVRFPTGAIKVLATQS